MKLDQPLTALTRQRHSQEGADISLWLRKTAAWVGQLRKVVLSAEWRTSNASWTLFCQTACEGGAKAAHSYIRAPVPWSSDPTTLGEEGEGWTAHITARLGREREAWKHCWDATESFEPQCLPPFPRCPLEPRLDPRIAQKTASSFKTATCPPDGVHPRHFGFLSPQRPRGSHVDPLDHRCHWAVPWSDPRSASAALS